MIRKQQSDSYFLHGTTIDSSVWTKSVVQSIDAVFTPEMNQRNIHLIDWSGANNTRARKDASLELLDQIKKLQRRKGSPQALNLIGHSHGGSILLYASQYLREILNSEVEINILTLNTPYVVGGAKLADPTVNHYHIYCPTDIVAPRGGFNKTGVLEKGGEKTNFFGKPIGGEYSYKRDMESGQEGTTSLKFASAITNISYADQYRFKGLKPRTHWVSHRGWLSKNVNHWLPALKHQLKRSIR